MRVYLGLGTNLGDKQAQLHRAVDEIEKRIGRVVALSSFYETAPWGFQSDHSFLNAVVEVETTLSPLDLLHATQAIERDLGRTAKSTDGAYHDRPIDIDILLYGDEVYHDGELQIPHPLMEQRSFVLLPLAEIAPTLVHPRLHHTIRQLLDELLHSAQNERKSV